MERNFTMGEKVAFLENLTDQLFGVIGDMYVSLDMPKHNVERYNELLYLWADYLSTELKAERKGVK